MEPLVQGTNDSSILSKYSMVQRGYFEDGVIKHFVTKDARRSPLIHLGYFARALVMDYAIKSFVQTSVEKNPQILSLGAGYDTTYFRLLPMFPDIEYFEVDLQDVVDNKIKTIKYSAELSSVLFDVSDGGFCFSCLRSRRYNIFTHDLSDTDGLDYKLTQLGFDFDQPTLVFSECAITYIEEERSTSLIKWIKRRIKAATLLNYEQFNPDDGFGKVMVTHFNKIQSPLRSLTKYRTVEEQRKRYSDAGWEHCRVCTVMDLFQHVLNPKDIARTFRIEPFDEWEEFHLKSCHYSLAIATPNTEFLASFPDCQHESTSRKSLVLHPMKKYIVERYAHSCVEISDRGVLVIGGFGSSNVHRHGRSKEIVYVGPTSKTVFQLSQASSVTWDCLYATCTAIGEDEFIIFGGRTSPAKEVNVDPVLVKVLIGEPNVELSSTEIPLASGNRPSPRWRHAAVHHQQSLLVYGGRNKELEVFGDLWELTVDEETWQWSQRMFQDGTGPCARFAHAMTTGGGKIYLAGGLDPQLSPLDDLWELEINKQEVVWRNIRPREPMPSMYSHTLHYHQHQLIFIGGVNTLPSDQPNLTILDLATLQAKHYFFEAAANDPAVMLHNHSSILNKEDSTISCYGGGGNCFSFGTHFNKHPLKIHLLEV